METLILQALDACAQSLERLRSNSELIQKIAAAGELLSQALEQGNIVISCGNGGSMCDAMHFAEELTGRFRENRPSLPAIAISDPGFLSCAANDFGYEHAFSRFVEGFGKPGDVLLAISTSGRSPNVLHAAQTAQAKNMKVIALTGREQSALSAFADVDICTTTPFPYADRVQELHIKVIHILIEMIERRMNLVEVRRD